MARANYSMACGQETLLKAELTEIVGYDIDNKVQDSHASLHNSNKLAFHICCMYILLEVLDDMNTCPALEGLEYSER